MKVRPLRDLILVERLEGHGIERITPGGIVIPASVERRAEQKADMFRAKVVATGPQVRELEPGDHVMVHTWEDGDGSKLYTGVTGTGRHELFIKPDDVICKVHPQAHVEGVQATGR